MTDAAETGFAHNIARFFRLIRRVVLLIRRVVLDVRVLSTAVQLLFLIAVIAGLALLTGSILDSMEEDNLTPSFSFLNNRAGFDIGEPAPWYSNRSTFLEAFLVGVINTLRVISVGLVAATLIGVLIGICLLSNNYLVRTIAKTYVELLRNTPLLVQLYVWYFIVMFSLPPIPQALAFPSEGVFFLRLRWLLYPLLIWIGGQYVKRRVGWRTVILFGAAAALMIEAGLWLASTRADWAAVPGLGQLRHPDWLLYTAVSALLLALAYLIASLWPTLRSLVRRYAYPIIAGQFTGALILVLINVPRAALRAEIYPAMYASVRGFVFPELLPTSRFNEWMLFVVVGLAVAVVLAVIYRRQAELTGESIPYFRYGVLIVIGFMIAGWALVRAEPSPAYVEVAQDDAIVTLPLTEAREGDLLTTEEIRLVSRDPLLVVLPQRINFNFEVGLRVSPEYMALLLGLTIYTSAFIAEIVRAGIQAVPYGQIEAARSIGLPQGKVLRMIVLPQALRVIVPPLGNQYLNLAKNSSLALAIAYPDLFQVMTTIMTTSGQSVPGMIMVMLTYLVISLIISGTTNVVNRRLRLA